MELALLELRDQFYRILDEGRDRPGIAHKVRTLFQEHPWFQTELQLAARRVLWRLRRRPLVTRWRPSAPGQGN